MYSAVSGSRSDQIYTGNQVMFKEFADSVEFFKIGINQKLHIPLTQSVILFVWLKY